MTNDELPEGWANTPVSSVCLSIADGDHQAPPQVESGVPFITISAIADGKLRLIKATRQVSEEYYEQLKAERRARQGDILFSVTGSIGKVAYVDHGDRFVFQRHIAVLRPDKTKTFGHYLLYALQTPNVQKQAHSVATGTAQLTIPLGGLRELTLPLAPLAEQKRIADKLEAVLGRVDACRARLDRVPALLKRFRQSVLAAATSGKLTDDWREENNSATDAETALCAVEGKRSGKLRVQKSEHSFEDISLFDLPLGWSWVKNHRLAVDASNAICAGPFGTIFKAKDFRDEGVPIIFLRHVGEGQYLTKKPGFMDPKVWRRQHQEYSVKGGELLVTKLGDPPGTACIYPNGVGVAMVTPDVMKMEVDTLVADTKFLMFFFNSPLCKDLVKELAFGATRLRIDLTMFKNFPIPLPPREEQIEIVRRVEALFAFADRIEARLTAARAQVERLTPATLAKAFRGDLVPQDPNDEPATTLFSRQGHTGAHTTKPPRYHKKI